MKFFKFTIFSILLFSFISCICSEAQVKYKSKKWKSAFFTIEVAGSYNLPIEESSGDIGDFFQFKNYGTKVGWGAQFNFKFGLGPIGSIRPYITLGYSQMQNSDDQKAYINTNWINAGYPLRNDGVYTPVPGKSEMFLRVPYAGAGLEYAFFEIDRKKRQFIPFVGLEMYVSVITGKYVQTSDVVQWLPGIETPYIIKTDVRVGIGTGAGMEIRFTPGFGMVFGFKYKLSNLIGKKSEFLLEENKMKLLDADATDLNKHLTQSRNISFMEFYLGASFFVGKSKK